MQIVGPYDWPIAKDENHPDYKIRECRVLNDGNVLVEGVRQVQVLLNTVQVSEILPDSVEKNVAEVAPNIHELVKKSILSAHIFDSQQEKLPKAKDPKRPSINLPRIYGISDIRRK